MSKQLVAYFRRDRKHPPRGVRIRLVNNSWGSAWMVLYTERNKYGRYSAAQFDANFSTREEVVTWVKKQPGLVLEESASDTKQGNYSA